MAIKFYSFVETGPIGRLKTISNKADKPDRFTRTVFNYKSDQIKAAEGKGLSEREEIFPY